jgi:hypothetical protein
MTARLLIAVGASALTLAAGPAISNEKIRAEFGDRGLTNLRDREIARPFGFARDGFAVTINGKTYESATLPTPKRDEEETQVVYTYEAGGFEFQVGYEARPGGRFLSKRITVRNSAPVQFKVDEIVLFRATLDDAPKESYVIARARQNLGTGDYGACLRYGSRGLLVTAQNPFLAFERDGKEFSLAYRPGMEWDPKWGAFESDVALLAPYEPTGDVVLEKCGRNGSWSRSTRSQAWTKRRSRRSRRWCARICCTGRRTR